MKKQLIVAILALFILLSCDKNDSNQTSNLVIKAGFICGWGSGEDSIEISQTLIKYVYYIPYK